MLRCPACGSRRLEVCGKISDDSGWTQCRDCGHKANPRAFVEGAGPTAHRARPLPAPTLATPALTLTCPACHTTGYYPVDAKRPVCCSCETPLVREEDDA